MQQNPNARPSRQTGGALYGCQYGEGFCVMAYRDEIGNVEFIWNSRDGVTPFIVRSRFGYESKHIAFQNDKCDPLHVPKVGDRIFVNLTMDRAREQRRAFVEKYWEHPKIPMRERYQSPDVAIEQLARADYESFGAGTSPDLVEVTEELLGILKTQRPPPYWPGPGAVTSFKPQGFA